MVYGHTFYFDQPVKRIWYAWGVQPAGEWWRDVYNDAVHNPTLIPNELYRLLRGEHRFTPSVVVSSDTGVEDPVTAELWVHTMVAGKVRQLAEQGYPAERIRECVINADDVVRRIKCLRSALTVNAGLYYDFNETAISDDEWDQMALKLVDLQRRYHYLLPLVDFFDNAFYGFDGSTGFHLPYRSEPFVTRIQRAMQYLEQHRKV